jgi:hypothetical protein
MVDSPPQSERNYHFASPAQPPWWKQIWSFARTAPYVNSEAQTPIQGELQRDLTGLVLAALARCSGMDVSELQRSPTLPHWIGQHLQPITHQTPEWMQFVALLGAKKLSKSLQLTNPAVLDPSLLDMETLPPVTVDAVTTTTTENDVSTHDTGMEEANQPTANVVVDVQTEPTPAEPHVTFLVEPEHSVKEEEEENPAESKKKRKRTATPRPPRTVDLPPVKATKKTKSPDKEKKVPDAPTLPPRVPRAPRSAPAAKKPKKQTVSDPSLPIVEDPTLLALPETITDAP